MRILFVSNPPRTVYKYMFTIAWALRTAGHEVRFASQPEFVDEVLQAGLTAVPVGHSRDMHKVAARTRGVENERAGIPAPYDVYEEPEKATWEHMVSTMANEGIEWHKYGNFPIISGLVEFARYWEPDLVVWDPLSFAGAIAAKACGAAHARLLFGVDVFGKVRQQFVKLRDAQPADQRRDPLAEWMGAYARKYGFDFTEDMFTGDFTLDQFPLSWQDEADLEYVRTQYIAYNGASVVPKWLQTPPAKPRIAITMGNSAVEVYRGYNVPLSDLLGSVADLDVEVVATVAASQQPLLGKTPDNARIVDFAPMHALAPTCSVVVHHAGAATMGTTARHPVPQLALPYHYDQPTLGKMLEKQGAGLSIHVSEVTPEKFRTAIDRLLTEQVFQDRAVALRDEIFALPTPNQAVPRIEELVVKHRAR